jgi:hypothetical protein
MILTRKNNADVLAHRFCCWSQYRGCYEILGHWSWWIVFQSGVWSSTTGMVSGLQRSSPLTISSMVRRRSSLVEHILPWSLVKLRENPRPCRLEGWGTEWILLNGWVFMDHFVRFAPRYRRLAKCQPSMPPLRIWNDLKMKNKWMIWYGMPCSFNFLWLMHVSIPPISGLSLTITGGYLWFVVYRMNHREIGSEPRNQRSLVGWLTPTLGG